MHRISLCLLAAILVVGLASVALADERPSIRVHAHAPDKALLRDLLESDLDIARIQGMEADIRVTQDELDDLRARGYRVAVETADLYSQDGLRGGGWLPEYTSYTEAAAEMSALNAAFPALTMLTSIGTSIQGREIWALKISDNAAIDEDEPEVLICGNHHAREVITVIISLHVATELLNGYGSNATYTDWVDNREIWIVPTVNPDGLSYVESSDLFWRKNRRNNGGGSFGVDINRNYDYEWNHDDNGSSGSPNSQVYRGTAPASEPETQAMQNFMAAHNFVVHQSYHAFGNLLLWGPGYKPGFEENEDIYAGFGAVVGAQNSYVPGNPASGTIYIVNGDTDDFAAHGAGHVGYLGLTPEVGTSADYFNPPASRIPALTTEGAICAWEVIRYAARLGQLAPPGQPVLDALPIDTDGDFVVTWNGPTTADTEVVQYEINQKTGPSSFVETVEGNVSDYSLGGWTKSAARAADGAFSFYSGSGNELNHMLWTEEPYLVTPGDFFEFDAWYNIETNWDYAYALLSTDGRRSHVNLAGSGTTMSDPNGNNADNGISGNSGGWTAMSFDLSAYVGQWVWLGVRYYTDAGVAPEGIYVDNLQPMQAWETNSTLSSGVTGDNPSFAVAGRADGTYYYAVRGIDAESDWGYWSVPLGVTVELSTDIRPGTGVHAFSLAAAAPNPFVTGTEIRFSLPTASEHSLTVYDVTGRRVRTLSSGRLAAGAHATTWDGRDSSGRRLPSGVYFYKLRGAAGELEQKAVLQR